jgi:hypothetical protein
VKFITSFVVYASSNVDGNFPIELAQKYTSNETFPSAAMTVTRPDGINGKSRSHKINKKASFPFVCNSFLMLGCVNFSFTVNNFIPFLYAINATSAPIDSPRKEIHMPSQKPKKVTLTAVMNTDGITANTAMTILTKILMAIAYSLYSINKCSNCSFKLVSSLLTPCTDKKIFVLPKTLLWKGWLYMNKNYDNILEEKRRELVDTIISYGVTSSKVLKISEELDDIINKYQSASNDQ